MIEGRRRGSERMLSKMRTRTSKKKRPSFVRATKANDRINEPTKFLPRPTSTIPRQAHRRIPKHKAHTRVHPNASPPTDSKRSPKSDQRTPNEMPLDLHTPNEASLTPSHQRTPFSQACACHTKYPRRKITAAPQEIRSQTKPNKCVCLRCDAFEGIKNSWRRL